MNTETTYTALVLREFKRLKQLGDRAIQQLPAEQFFTTLGDGDNSVALLIKHVSGNMLSRWSDFLNSDGEKPDRNRDSEFVVMPHDSREQLMTRWEEGWATLFNALSPLGPADLDRSVTIRGERLTVLQAINRQLTHYAYHVGQLVFLAKHFVGEEWVSLSIPKGKSEDFNREPRKYL